MSKVLQEVSDKASKELGMNLNGYKPRVVQHDSDGMNIIYFPPNPVEERDIVFISCKTTRSGIQIIGHNSGSAYLINKMCRKMGINMPTEWLKKYKSRHQIISDYMKSITIILGSTSDKPIFDKCKSIFNEFGIKYNTHIASAHRTPEKVDEIVKNSDSDVFIAIAGLSAALPGMMTSKTTRPVIGIPVESKLDGLDALLSMVRMPPGIPVGVVGIDRGENAALLAIQILSLQDENLKLKLKNYREKMKESIRKADLEAKKW